MSYFDKDEFYRDVLGGYVKLIDVMPHPLDFAEGETCDSAICKSARVSYQKGTVKKTTDKQLIRYLMRHSHTSPFEQVEFRFELQVPISVERQLVRHRTASLNVESSRYSVMEDKMYLPDALRNQSQSNKQGSENAEFVASQEGVLEEDLMRDLEESQARAYGSYTRLLEAGVARELARDVLPLSLYTKMVWKCDLLNFMKFCRLRLDSHAQLEIRTFAQAMYDLVKSFAPWTFEAFEDYWKNGVSFSAQELKLLKELIYPYNRNGGHIAPWSPLFVEKVSSVLSKGEAKEFHDKLSLILYPFGLSS